MTPGRVSRLTEVVLGWQRRALYNSQAPGRQRWEASHAAVLRDLKIGAWFLQLIKIESLVVPLKNSYSTADVPATYSHIYGRNGLILLPQCTHTKL